MITASEIAKEINRFDPKIDALIANYLKPIFVAKNAHNITVSLQELNQHYGADFLLPATFINEMSRRGFCVSYKDDLSGFTISIPPQG
ncbi:MAG: hypothetical protein R3230_00135 [Nitrosopumilaceae archaeon]|nr:hypothetical protein [Nitrosopumilaceae archaeon]